MGEAGGGGRREGEGRARGLEFLSYEQFPVFHLEGKVNLSYGLYPKKTQPMDA